MEDPELIAALLEAIKAQVTEVQLTETRDQTIYSFKLNGASMKGFGGGAVKLELKCEDKPQQSPPKKQPQTPTTPKEEPQPPKQEKKEEPAPKKEEPPKEEPKVEEDTKEKEEPKAKKPESPKKKKDSKPTTPATPIFQAATPMTVKPKEAEYQPPPEDEEKDKEELAKLKDQNSSNKSKGKRRKRTTIDETVDDPPPEQPKLLNRSSSMKASKCVFGTLRTGREKRIHSANTYTFDNCEYIPNFKGSERGCVLKKSNKELEARGIVKKSQIEKFNDVDVSGEPLKKIKKLIDQYCKLEKDFAVTFSIPDIELSTVEIQFNGEFCPNVEFSKDYEGNNYIIKDIPECDDNKYLLNKAELKPGYKILKVKGQSVNNKPFKDTKKLLDKAGKDGRVNYQVVFIEGKLSWYNFTSPYPKEMEEKKVDLPRIKAGGSGRSGRRKRTTDSPRKTPRKQSARTPRMRSKSPGPSPTTPRSPRSPIAKNPKYFLKDKKNEKCYFDMRIEGDKRGRLEIVLFSGIVPKTCKNFMGFCTGENKKKLSYKGKKFYKMYIGMGLEGGDVENNDGTGKTSIYGGYFEDENFKIRHSRYALSMKNNDEPDTNASQFYIMTAEDADFLDGKNVVFGYIADKKSQELIDDMEEEGCSLTGKPKVKAVISKCGKLKK